MLFLFANLRKIKVKRNFYNKKDGSFDTTDERKGDPGMIVYEGSEQI